MTLNDIIGFPGSSEVKASACNVGDLGSNLGCEDPLEKGNGNPLQYSCLENPMDGGAWWVIVHRVVKSQTRLSDLTNLIILRTLKTHPTSPLHFQPAQTIFISLKVSSCLFMASEPTVSKA